LAAPDHADNRDRHAVDTLRAVDIDGKG
jgi:hypothetical protein